MWIDARLLAVDAIGHLAVALVGGDGALRTVDGQLQIVGTHAVSLRVGIREGAPLQQLVVGEIQAVHHHARAEGDLLHFGEVVLRVSVQHHAAHGTEGAELGRPDLGGVERIKIELGVLAVLHHLYLQLPLGEIAARNGIVQIFRGVIEVLALDGLGFGLQEIPLALLRDPVVLHEHTLTLRIHPLVRVNAGAAHLAVVRRDAPRTEQEGDHVHCRRGQADEVEDAPRVLPVGHRVGLEGMDDVGKFHRVADEEDLQVIADEIPVAVLGIELHREAARIAQGLG